MSFRNPSPQTFRQGFVNTGTGQGQTGQTPQYFPNDQSRSVQRIENSQQPSQEAVASQAATREPDPIARDLENQEPLSHQGEPRVSAKSEPAPPLLPEVPTEASHAKQEEATSAPDENPSMDAPQQQQHSSEASSTEVPEDPASLLCESSAAQAAQISPEEVARDGIESPDGSTSTQATRPSIVSVGDTNSPLESSSPQVSLAGTTQSCNARVFEDLVKVPPGWRRLILSESVIYYRWVWSLFDMLLAIETIE